MESTLQRYQRDDIYKYDVIEYKNKRKSPQFLCDPIDKTS